MERTKQPVLAVIACTLTLALTPAALSKIIHVDDDAPPGGNGSSWASAYQFLQDALEAAADLDKPVEIWVARGTYRPDEGKNQAQGNRAATFQLISGVTLRGGYAGLGGPDPNARDVNFYQSILSGDLAGNDSRVDDPGDMLNDPTRLDNSHHVVTIGNNESASVIDGFIIAGGHAEPNVPYQAMPYDPVGGGLYNVRGRPTILNCTFRANLAGNGGAVYSEGGSLQLIQCEFHANAALLKEKKFADRLEGWYGQGGGVDTERGILTIEKCRFTDNLAAKGGGVSGIGWRGSVPPGEEDTKVVLTDCTFLDNRATVSGGGVFVESTTPVLTRCIFTRNSADTGGAIYSLGGAGLFTACSFTANSAGHEGGGMANSLANATVLTNCTFVSNSTGAHGGGMYNSQSTIRMSNSRFSGNRTGVDLEKYGGVVGGGAIYNTNDCNVLITNCTFSGNKGLAGNALDSLGHLSWCPSIIRVTNCILWDGERGIANRDGSRIDITYSTIQGGSPGEGNISVDPRFVNAGRWDSNGTRTNANDDFWIDGDYHLKSQAGRWDPNSPIGDEPFPNGGRINMGAYGGTAEASKSYFGEPICKTIIAGDINGDCQVDFADLAIVASHWLWDADALPAQPSPDQTKR